MTESTISFEDLPDIEPEAPSISFDDLPDLPTSGAPEISFDDLPDLAPEESSGIGDDTSNIGRALLRGAHSLRQNFFATGILNADKAASEAQKAMEELKSFDALMASPDNMLAMRRNPLVKSDFEQRRKRLEGKVAQLAGEAQQRSQQVPSSLQAIAQSEAAKQALPVTGGLKEFYEGDWKKALLTNPIEVVSGLIAESLPQAAPGIIGTMMTGGAGGAGITAASSFSQEYASAILDSARKAGVDVTNPDSIEAFIKNPEQLNKAREFAAERSVPISIFDGATAGLAGRILRRALGKGAAPVIAATAGETGLQMAGGAAGETAAQLASEGRIIDPRSIAAEAIAEVGSAPGEIFGNLRGANAPVVAEPVVETGEQLEQPISGTAGPPIAQRRKRVEYGRNPITGETELLEVDDTEVAETASPDMGNPMSENPIKPNPNLQPVDEQQLAQRVTQAPPGSPQAKSAISLVGEPELATEEVAPTPAEKVASTPSPQGLSGPAFVENNEKDNANVDAYIDSLEPGIYEVVDSDGEVSSTIEVSRSRKGKNIAFIVGAGEEFGLKSELIWNRQTNADGSTSYTRSTLRKAGTASTTEATVAEDATVQPTAEEEVTEIVEPESAPPRSRDDSLIAAEKFASDIADRITQGQGTLVRDAAYEAAKEAALEGIAKTGNFSPRVMTLRAEGAVTSEFKRSGKSLDEEERSPLEEEIDSDTPEIESRRQNAKALLQEAMREFSPEERAILSTAGDQGAQAAVAKKLGVSRAAVSQRFQRLSKRLREKLESKGVSRVSDVLSPAPKSTSGVPLEMEGEGSVSVPEVMTSYEGIIKAIGGNAPIRFGRFFQRALGIYKTGAKVSRIKGSGDIATAAHETAHALQDRLFGDAGSHILRSKLPGGVLTEIRNLGKALYGSKVPKNGYESEGWAEFVRYYLTTDTAKSIAPATSRYFEKLLQSNPELAKAIENARTVTSTWRKQGAFKRAKAQMPMPPGRIKSSGSKAASIFSKENWIEEFAPLKELADEYRKVTGNALTPASNPYELASMKRGSTGSTVMQMVEHGMVDPWGNLVFSEDGRAIGSLREILQPARGLEDELGVYLWARRSVHLHSRGINPGMSLQDAEYLVDSLDRKHPQFSIVANRLYEWQNSVLDYLKSANPGLAPSIEKIREKSQDYVPLARVVDSKEAKSLAAKLASNPMRRIKGSGRQIKPIFDQIINNTFKIVASGNKHLVLDSIVKLSKADGLGYLVEEVPRDRVKNSLSVDQIKSQLEELGVDVSGIKPDEIITYYSLATTPKGVDPVIPIREGNDIKWYQVSSRMYDLLQGLEPSRLGPILDFFFGAPARLFRLGTTGLRASFSLVTNPLRDLQTFLAQTTGTNNPVRALGSYFKALQETLTSAALGKESPYVELFKQLGVEGGQPLGIDIHYTRKAAKGLFKGAIYRRVTSPIESFRELLSLTEKVPRLAEMKMVAKQVGWNPGTPITPDQAVAIANAGKRITTDFSAGGRLAKQVNQFVAFFNAVIQGARSFARVFKNQPVASTVRALAYFILPALALWWRNKDEDWYRRLPWRERFLYWNFSPDGVNVIQIPRNQEWSGLSVAGEALADWWHTQDPVGAKHALGHIFETVNPLDWPVSARVAIEQWRNKLDFWDRPIVPRSEIDLPPGEQSSEYNSEIAKALGRAFPDSVSPRRVDAAIRSIGGGVAGDLLNGSDVLMQKLGIKDPKQAKEREQELSDTYILGRLFRRGGTYSSHDRIVNDFYDQYSLWKARSRSKDNKLTGAKLDYWKKLDRTYEAIKVLRDTAKNTSKMSARQSLNRSISRLAEKAISHPPAE